MLERVFRDSRVSKASSLLTYDACVTWDSEPAGMSRTIPDSDRWTDKTSFDILDHVLDKCTDCRVDGQ